MQIHRYVRDGNIEGVAAELSVGVSIELPEEGHEAYTPLMCALSSERAGNQMVRSLIERGADVNAITEPPPIERLQIPEELRASISERMSDYMGEEMASRIEAVCDDGENRAFPKTNVLSLAAKAASLEILDLLLEHGANIAYQLPAGYDVLIDAVHSDAYSDESALIEWLQVLIEKGAPLNGVSDYNESALRVCAHRGHFEAVRFLLKVGADPQLLQWTELMSAIAMGSRQDVEQQLEADVDLTAKDWWNRTPWLLSVSTGDIEKAKLLVAAGADIGERGHCGNTALHYACEYDHAPMLKWLLLHGPDIEALNDFDDKPILTAIENGAIECIPLLIAAGADILAPDAYDYSPIRNAPDTATVRLLIEHGASLSDISDEIRAELTGVRYDEDPQLTLEEYTEGSQPRFGTSNPELMNIALWKEMVRCGATAYRARMSVGNDLTTETESAFEETGPVWCFHRFGKSITEMPDGRFIEIGGEHEDHYDPDFCIYNDVVVHHGGGLFDIYGYPEKVFPPTDFHSATLMGNNIYIIGCLGYPEDRKSGKTPVYRLDCTTYAIEKVKTTGKNPGWINAHSAYLRNGEIVVSGGKISTKSLGRENYTDNDKEWILNLESMKWRCNR